MFSMKIVFLTGQSYEIKLKKVGALTNERELYKVSDSQLNYSHKSGIDY